LLFQGILLDIFGEGAMGSAALTRALKNYRKRLNERGMGRFEVLGLDSDRELVRALARRLAENDSEAAEIRASVRSKVEPDAPKRGGILAMLRSWPLADLDLSRPVVEPREIDL
jgi:hypothetical protein